MFRRAILLLDLDSFYAQVLAQKHGVRKEEPHAVRQHDSLIAVSYSAKRLGLGKRMRVADALRQVPNLRMLPVEEVNGKISLRPFREQSRRVMAIYEQYVESVSGTLERASIDEAYLDITAAVDTMMREEMQSVAGRPQWDEDEHGVVIDADGGGNDDDLDVGDDTSVEEWRMFCAAKIARMLRRRVHEQLGFDVSAGISHNKLLAKMAASLNKPNGQAVVISSGIASLMASTQISRLPSFGGKLGERISAQFPQCTTVSDLWRAPRSVLHERLGASSAEHVYELVRGFDHREVKQRTLVQSITAFASMAATGRGLSAHEVLNNICGEIAERIAADTEQNARRPTALALHFANSNGSASRALALPTTVTKDTLFDVADPVLRDVERQGGVVRLGLAASSFVDVDAGSVAVLKNFLVDGTAATFVICPECGNRISPERADEHRDFHVALKISEEMRETDKKRSVSATQAQPGAKKSKKASKAAAASSKSIDSFFKRSKS